jgi:hypothetical protein
VRRCDQRSNRGMSVKRRRPLRADARRRGEASVYGVTEGHRSQLPSRRLCPGCGAPRSHPRRRGSTPGSVLCPVRRHLCDVLGVRCVMGSRTPTPAPGAPGVNRITRRPSDSCTPPRRLPTPHPSISPAGQPPSSFAGQAYRPRESVWRDRLLGPAVLRPARPESSSVPSAAAGTPAVPPQRRHLRRR